MSSHIAETIFNVPKKANWQCADLHDSDVKKEANSSTNLLDFYTKYYQKPDRRSHKRGQSDRRQKIRMAGISNDIYAVQKTVEQVKHKTEEVKSEIKRVDTFVKENSEEATELLTSLNAVAPFRRVTSVPNKIKENDYAGAILSVGVAATLLPEDLRDIRDAARQLNSMVLPKKLKNYLKAKNPKIHKHLVDYKPAYDYKNYQLPFSFVRGSFLEKIVNRKPGKLSNFVHEHDNSLLETSFGQKIQKLLKVESKDYKFISRDVPAVKYYNGKYFVENLNPVAVSLKGSKFGKLICRSMQRLTLYGSAALLLANMPSIALAYKRGESKEEKLANASKQAVKVAINVTTCLSGIALGGTLLAPLGPLGSVIGMGLGCTIGAYVSNIMAKVLKLNNK